MKKIFLCCLVIFYILLSGIVAVPNAYAFSEEEKLVLQCWRLVNEAYVDSSFNGQNWWGLRQKILRKPLNNREETYGVIREMLASLDDPYTRLLPPERYHDLQITTSGELSGVGLQISVNPETKHIEVVSPLPNSPAEDAGIHPRDEVISIDGVRADTLSLDEAASRIRGKVGTEVTLEIKPKDKDIVNVYHLRRDRLSLSSVISRLDDSNPDFPVGYLRLNQFSGSATKDLAHAIALFEQKNVKGYILDLRNNPGGLLQAGVEIARLWLKPSTIVYTVNRQGTMGSYDAMGEPITDAPLVVLVNQGTASASEILAGALQDNGRAILVGEKTYGKGLIQSLFELPDGAGLAVTVAKYETPNHKDINKLGISPDFVVSQEPINYFEIGTDVDLQYQRAIASLQQS
ncbi:PDZ domain-containing protein [Cyanobacterium stanieri LEGE 03274]|uniref:PDZ domain-containing protein n=1 Tax=Cyanobacterium stanieri LEGE 03274 TaxID=1828756 RepID=A0ABR9V623_9CHRO|nr:carboxyl-terminal processing protease CtpA [Cyanobacterium stanieri]MBE9223337.1 PDZ domain-containing protein [Cyanobacterium stanieri LEGE 03274]